MKSLSEKYFSGRLFVCFTKPSFLRWKILAGQHYFEKLKGGATAASSLFLRKNKLAMSENSPLDAGMGEIENARPAGEWLEGYWRQTQPWAMAVAWLCWLCAIWQGYLMIRQWVVYERDAMSIEGFAYHAGIALQVIPVLLIGYFLFQFASHLRLALDKTDQIFLESAFQQLWRAFLLIFMTAGYWILGWSLQVFLFFRDTLTETFEN